MSTEPISQDTTNTINQMALLDAQDELDGLRALNSRVVGAVYDRYFEDVYRFVYYRLNDEQVAEDISSDVFVRLLEAIQKRRGPQTNLKGWLLATASHAVADYLRQAYRRPTEELSDVMPDDSAPSLTDEVDRREQVGSVQEAYAQLTRRSAECIGLAFWGWILIGRDGESDAKECECREGPPVSGVSSVAAEHWGGGE